MEVLVKLFNKGLYHAAHPVEKNAIITIVDGNGNKFTLAAWILHYKLAFTDTQALCQGISHFTYHIYPRARWILAHRGYHHSVRVFNHCAYWHDDVTDGEVSLEAFVFYEKAFNSADIDRCNTFSTAVISNLLRWCITRVLYFGHTVRANPCPVPIRRGVRKGDTIFPKLFTAVLEVVIKW